MSAIKQPYQPDYRIEMCWVSQHRQQQLPSAKRETCTALGGAGPLSYLTTTTPRPPPTTYTPYHHSVPPSCQAMASANSRGDSEGCGRGFIQAMTATLLVSCVLVCVLLSAPETLLGLFQTDEEVLALAKTYCMIRCVCVCVCVLGIG